MKLPRLFFKNLALLLIPFLIPLFILGSFSLYITENIITQQVTDDLRNYSSQLKVQMDFPFMDMDGLLQSFNTDPMTINFVKSILTKQSYSLDEIRSLNLLLSMISSFINTKPYFHSVYIYSENDMGRFITSSNGVVDTSNFWDTEWMDILDSLGDYQYYTCVRNIRQALSDPVGVKVVTIFVKNMGYPGCLVFNFNYSYFEDALEALFDKELYSVFIFDESKRCIISLPDTVVVPYGSLDLDENHVQSLLHGGQDYFYAGTKSIQNGWEYYVLLPKDRALVLPDTIRSIIVLLIAISCVIGIVVSIYITKKNNRWLQEIVDILNQTENVNTVSPIDHRMDSYTEIVHNILQVFMEKNYLQAHHRSLELTALQAQINPHFLYNTLNAVYWETIRLGEGPSQATDMLEKLSRILEYAISNPLESVMLADELNYTKDYIAIQEYRFPGRFTVDWKVECDVEQTRSMKLLLQPLVENSISHGFRDIPRQGKLYIELIDTGEVLEVLVRDNGSGMDDAKLNLLQEKTVNAPYDETNHVGLVNTVRRIKLFYGPDVRFSIESRLDIGTEIFLTLPK